MGMSQTNLNKLSLRSFPSTLSSPRSYPPCHSIVRNGHLYILHLHSIYPYETPSSLTISSYPASAPSTSTTSTSGLNAVDALENRSTDQPISMAYGA